MCVKTFQLQPVFYFLYTKVQFFIENCYIFALIFNHFK